MAPNADPVAGLHPGSVVCLLNGEGRVLRIQSEHDRCWGYETETLVGHRLCDLVHGDDAAMASAELDALSTGRAAGAFHSRMLRADGESTPMLWGCCWVAAEQQCVCVGIGAAPRDDYEQRFRSLFDGHPDAMCAFSPDGRFADANARAEALSGYSRDELAAMSFDALIEPSDRARVREHFEFSLAGQSQHFETGAVDRAGRRLQLDITAIPARHDGRVTGVYAIARDVTAGHEAATALAHRTETLHAILDSMREGVVIAAEDGTLLEVNPAARCLMGMETDAPLPPRWPADVRLFADRAGEHPLAPVVRPLARALRGERLEGMECYLRHPLHPEGLALSVTGGPLTNPAGHSHGGVIVWRDITRQKTAEARLRLAARALGTTAEGVFITDGGGHLVSINRAFTRITGYTAETAAGRSLDTLLNLEDDGATLTAMWQAASEGTYWQGEISGTRQTGEPYPALLTVNAVPEDDELPRHYVGVLTDVSRYKAYEARLEHMARHDALTHLPARSLFEERLRAQLAGHRRGDGLVVVLFIDLDNFKTINDAYGHTLGDALLRVVADRLRHALRDSDLVARLGGDEFVALLGGLRQPEEAGPVAAKLLASLTEPARCNGIELRVSASVGISCYPNDADSIHSLLEHADSAMYQAKASGRNRYAYFSEEADAEVCLRLRIARDLRRALDPADLRPMYQPRYDLANGRLRGVEALVRWQHPELGLLTPDRFLPIAEDLGMLCTIDEWVLESACRQARRWHEAGWTLELAVNVSGCHLDRPDPLQYLKPMVTTAGLTHDMLRLELNASELISAERRGLWLVGCVSSVGLSLEADPEGGAIAIAGLPVSYLKVGAEVTDNPEWLAALMRVRRATGLRIIAERIERTGQRDALLAAGCREGQGLLLGAPRTAEDITRLLTNGDAV